MQNIECYGMRAEMSAVSFDTFFSSFHFEKNTQDDSGGEARDAAARFGRSHKRDCLVGHRELCDSGAAAGSRSGFGGNAGISSRCGHAVAFTYNYVKPHPERPASHDLSASQSEAARSECVGRLNAATQYMDYELVSGSTYQANYQTQEEYIYGSSRLGVLNTETTLPVKSRQFTSSGFGSDGRFIITQWITEQTGGTACAVNCDNPGSRTLGSKQYELSNHLGNVQTTISDRRIAVPYGSNLDHYIADVISSTDYYPFGSAMPGRNSNSSDYRYSYNGKEQDNEIKGTGNSLDFGARMYDSRLGRWLSIDPYSKKYPDLSPYVGFENSPISIVDPGGDTTVYYSSSGKLLHFSYDKLPTAVVLVSDNDIKRFNMQFSLIKKAGMENNNTANNRLRKFGLNIMIDEYRKFYNDHTVVGEHDKGNVNRFNEYKVNLYIKDNKLVIGSKVITSNDPGNVTGDPDVEKDKGTLVGDSHTHPNEGLPVESGSWEYGPSKNADMINRDDYNVVVGREQIYIYGEKLPTTIITINKQTLQKGHRDAE